MKCLLCNKGTWYRTAIMWPAALSNGHIVNVWNVEVDKCDHCGEVAFDAKAGQKIDDAIEKKFPGYFRK